MQYPQSRSHRRPVPRPAARARCGRRVRLGGLSGKPDPSDPIWKTSVRADPQVAILRDTEEEPDSTRHEG